MAMTLAGAGVLALYGGNVVEAAAVGAQQVEQSISSDQAQKALDKARDQQQKTTKQAVRADKITVPATAVEIVGSKSLTEKDVRALVPELNKERINIHTLSKQIQMVNDTGAAKLGANFVSNHDGTFTVKVANEAKDNDKFTISLANNGNEHTGDWRATLSYINNNLSKNADTFGMAYVTSPDEHFSDVKMGAVSYRRLLPKASGSLNVTASVYDIEQDQTPLIAAGGVLNSESNGKGHNIGLHYQQHLAYTSREKDMWDFGIDYRQVETTGELSFGGVPLGIPQTEDYDMLIGSVGFVHNNRDTHHSFTYNAGVYVNLKGDDAAYNRNVPVAGFGKYDDNFVYYQAGVNYQVRSNSDWILGARLHGQYTNDNLVGLAQIGAGGMNTVRGFENSISADKGIVGNLEVYTPEFAPHSRFVAFYDYGNLTNNREGASFDSVSLSSVGIGYRYNNPKSGLTLAVDYANPVEDVDSKISNTTNHRRWNATVSMSF
ncbi:Hemolysin activation/secretion protein [Selenomonas sp. GACV-9]|uniref:ShlB/FhaC/HecB family hemolysin secretion/activation protein n=1 Tax=Selenomonas sp. GACV-9 TaxID=3158782 RepID=UPI0008ECDFB4|nr:Hemolysin activation/secretion protein [Selenomonas ruminantium]